MAAGDTAAGTSDDSKAVVNGAVSDELSSKRGIPPMKFIESVDDYMADTVGKDASVEDSVRTAIKTLEELYQKYKYAEANMYQQKTRLKQKLPELRNSLDLLAALEQKRGRGDNATTRFLLSDQCYATAQLENTDSVHLWLGANTMLEYPIGEARELLSTNLRNAEKNIEELSGELEFVKDQITTSEVNMARVYNWGVQKRKARPS